MPEWTATKIADDLARYARKLEPDVLAGLRGEENCRRDHSGPQPEVR